MTLPKKLNLKFLIFSFLTLLIVTVAAYSTINNSQKANALNSALSSLTDTAQYQKFYTITTPASSGGNNYLYYELPIIAGGTSTLNPNDYLEVAAIKTETLEDNGTGTFVTVASKTFNYTPAEIAKATSAATVSGKPGMVLKFSPGIGCGTGATCTIYTDPNAVLPADKTYKASPNSRAQVSVSLKIKSSAPTLIDTTAFISAANWVTPGGFPSERVVSQDIWNVAFNYTATAQSTEVNPDTGGNVGNLTSCTPAATAITIGTVYSCDFPLTGTAPFVLPTGGISAKTNQGTNNSSPVSTCTVAASVLTCTGIKTDSTSFIAGAAKVQLAKGTISTTSTWNDKGAVTLVTPVATTEVNPDTGGNVGNLTSCTPAATAITIGTVYSCDFPLTGTAPFTLPTGGISAKTNQGTNNSSPISTCTIAGSVLTCTGVKTDSTSFIAGAAKVQLAKGTISTTSTWNDKGAVTLVVATTTSSATVSSTTISVARSTPTVGQLPTTGGFSVALALISGLGALGSFAYLSRRKGLRDGTADLSVKSKKSKSDIK
ncbi:MAG: LPXTG cell wall anchor domain-containing protein [bacterium]